MSAALGEVAVAYNSWSDVQMVILPHQKDEKETYENVVPMFGSALGHGSRPSSQGKRP